ncbi:MAG: KilA-N domain-containing protein [Bacteroidia bacterium]|nr:KilA-N domain-containing protein [Bacteroidia bacterium]
MSEKIYIDGKEISVKSIDEQDYISLTDMVRDRRNPSQAINNWLRNRDTLELLSFWESMNNPDFNLLEFEKIRNEAGRNAFTISVKNWIQETGAIGLEAKAGRYGGTFGHRDLAFAFASWVSPLFQLMLIREFQHLKSHEYQRQKLEWDAGRFLSKVNYSLQADAIENTILPRISEKDGKFIYADEADLINLVIFGMTAKEWREANPDAKGNIRDHASLIQLVVLSNLETHNADYIRAGASKEARYRRLCEIAAKQVEVFKRDIRLSDDRKFLK